MSTTIPIVTRPRKTPRLAEDLASLVRGSQQARPVVLRLSWNRSGWDAAGRTVRPRTASWSSRIHLSRARTLKQLDEEFRNRYGQLRQQYASLVYSSILPEPLQALIIGPGATAP